MPQNIPIKILTSIGMSCFVTSRSRMGSVIGNSLLVMRWAGKLKALFKVHEEIVQEMLARGYNHKSPLDKTLAKGKSVQTSFVDPVEKQIELLRQKGCSCRKKERLRSVAELPTAS